MTGRHVNTHCNAHSLSPFELTATGKSNTHTHTLDAKEFTGMPQVLTTEETRVNIKLETLPGKIFNDILKDLVL